MYTLYIPKYEGDLPKFNIIRALSMYSSSVNYQFNIISAPGYMSRTEYTIEKFLRKLNGTLDDTRTHYISFFNGMNGNNLLYLFPSTTIKEHHDNLVPRLLPRFKLIRTNCKSNKDHRKMLFFYEFNDDPINENENNNPLMNEIIKGNWELNQLNYRDFLNCITVHAIMIGSSNQSLNTYYSARADKGEADLFMFADADVNFTNVLLREMESETNNMVLSRSIHTLRGGDEGYMKEILHEFLSNSLL